MKLVPLLFYGFGFWGLLSAVVMFIFSARAKKKANGVIAMLLFVQSIVILESALYWTGWIQRFPLLNNSNLYLIPLFGPFLYIYLELVLHDKNQIKKYIPHLLPFLILFPIIILSQFNSISPVLKSQLNKVNFYRWPSLFPYVSFTSLVVYFFILYRNIKLNKYVGYIQGWLKAIIYLFGAYALCYTFYLYAVKQSWFTPTADYFISLLSCISIFALVIYTLTKEKVFNGYAPHEALLAFPVTPTPMIAASLPSESKNTIQPVEKYKNSALTPDTLTKLAHNLDDLMHTERLYSEPELKLESIAIKMNLERHYVSQVINQYFQMNFFEYINKLRIEEAKKLLLAEKNLNIIEIAYMVGYNNKSTFNTAFKRITGKTPKEFRLGGL